MGVRSNAMGYSVISLLMNEVTLQARLGVDGHASVQGRDLQGYLSHKKPPAPHRTTIGP